MPRQGCFFHNTCSKMYDITIAGCIPEFSDKFPKNPNYHAIQNIFLPRRERLRGIFRDTNAVFLYDSFSGGKNVSVNVLNTFFVRCKVQERRSIGIHSMDH